LNKVAAWKSGIGIVAKLDFARYGSLGVTLSAKNVRLCRATPYKAQQ